MDDDMIARQSIGHHLLQPERLEKIVATRHGNVIRDSLVSIFGVTNQVICAKFACRMIDVHGDYADMKPGLLLERTEKQARPLIELRYVSGDVPRLPVPRPGIQHMHRFRLRHPARPALRRIIRFYGANEILAGLNSDNRLGGFRAVRRLHLFPLGMLAGSCVPLARSSGPSLFDEMSKSTWVSRRRSPWNGPKHWSSRRC